MVLAFIKRIISAPVMRSIVKARQARKNVEVWMRGVCFSWHPTYFIKFRLGLWCASFKSFPSNRGAVSFFKMMFQ